MGYEEDRETRIRRRNRERVEKVAKAAELPELVEERDAIKIELERLRAFGDALYNAALAYPEEDDWLGEHLRNWASARANPIDLKGTQ